MHHAHIDRFSQGDSPVHRLDPRVKLLAVMAYSVVLVTYGRYDLSLLAPLCVGPLAMLRLGEVPMRFALRRVLVLSPFVVSLAAMAVIYDAAPRTVWLGPWTATIRGGILAAGNLALRFALAILALTALMSTTRFGTLMEGLRRMGCPRVLVVQLGFLYRYIFVLIDEAMRLRRARDFRGSPRSVSARLRAVGGIIASLFVRTLDRSDRIALAMAARGYAGEVHSLGRLGPGRGDLLFGVIAGGYLLACRVAYPALV